LESFSICYCRIEKQNTENITPNFLELNTSNDSLDQITAEIAQLKERLPTSNSLQERDEDTLQVVPYTLPSQPSEAPNTHTTTALSSNTPAPTTTNSHENEARTEESPNHKSYENILFIEPNHSEESIGLSTGCDGECSEQHPSTEQTVATSQSQAIDVFTLDNEQPQNQFQQQQQQQQQQQAHVFVIFCSCVDIFINHTIKTE
jgi:hypothetical protein